MHSNGSMKTMSRREVLGSATLTAGAGVLSACSKPPSAQTAATVSAPTPAATDANPWAYTALDPEAVVAHVEALFPEGGCMYALFGGVVSALADLHGEPYASFPIHMMRYGEGGIGGWGTICGALNGGAALIGLFHPEKEKQRKVQLIDELLSYYQRTSLPVHVPDGEEALEQSVSDSVLCHISVGRWCRAAGKNAFSPAKKERCRRTTIDIARRTVEVLNASLGTRMDLWGLSEETESCIYCHGKRQLGDAMGKMECDLCHEIVEPHGK